MWSDEFRERNPRLTKSVLPKSVSFQFYLLNIDSPTTVDQETIYMIPMIFVIDVIMEELEFSSPPTTQRNRDVCFWFKTVNLNPFPKEIVHHCYGPKV